MPDENDRTDSAAPPPISNNHPLRETALTVFSEDERDILLRAADLLESGMYELTGGAGTGYHHRVARALERDAHYLIESARHALGEWPGVDPVRRATEEALHGLEAAHGALSAVLDGEDAATRTVPPVPNTPEHRLQVEDALALLRLAARVAERGASVEAALVSDERGVFRWGSLAQAIRHDLHGDGVGGTLDKPSDDSLLGRVERMMGWSDEQWDRVFEAEKSDLDGEAD